jgi:hypothetical protein
MSQQDRYLPIPVWNAHTRQWEPVDYRRGQMLVTWPAGVDLIKLPEPLYHDNDAVQFVRDETCAREGVVRLVRLAGGGYGPFEIFEEVVNQCYYQADQLTYLVTARGHDHIIKERQILGKFVSHWRSC